MPTSVVLGLFLLVRISDQYLQFYANSWALGKKHGPDCLSCLNWFPKKLNWWQDSQVVAVVVGGVGFCVWRFFRKRRITKEQVPLARLEIMKKTLPKAQRTRGLSSAYQSDFFRSYHKFFHKSWTNIFRISTKHQLQNPSQTSSFRQNLNLEILTKPSFRISAKIEFHNHKQTSVAK